MQDSGRNSEWHGERVERIKANGKRTFSTAFKVWLVAQASQPGVSVSALAMRHEINANQLRRWMRLEHLTRATPVPAVLPVAVVAPACEQGSAAALPEMAQRAPIELEIAGVVVRVYSGADAALIRAVLQALRA
jgi:transposase